MHIYFPFFTCLFKILFYFCSTHQARKMERAVLQTVNTAVRGSRAWNRSLPVLKVRLRGACGCLLQF